MEEYIKGIIREYDGNYLPIGDEKSLLNIYNFYKYGIISKEEPNAIEALYYAYLFNKKDEKESAIKYWKISIEKGSSDALVDLADEYKKEKNYELMKETLLLAIEKGNSGAMKNLGYYYEHIEINIELMKYYYGMAIKSENSYAMNNLAFYYQYTEKNIELMKKYYIMAIERNNSMAMNNFGLYYEKEKDNDSAIKYYMMTFKNEGSTHLFYEFFRKNEDNFSFLELYQEKNFPYKLLERFKENIILPKKYYFHFSNLNILFNDSISQIIKNKQFILKKTGVWPSNYNKKYMIQFMELLTIRKSPLPKDLVLLIAGYLFV